MQTTLRKIGNSKGVILSKEILHQANVTDQVHIEVKDGEIIIRRAIAFPNLDSSKWPAQFKSALSKRSEPDKEYWEDALTIEEEREWQ